VPYQEVISEGNLATFTELLNGEKLAVEYSKIDQIANMNTFAFKALKFIMQKMQPRVGLILGACEKLNTH
jgi:hypothetical protein